MAEIFRIPNCPLCGLDLSAMTVEGAKAHLEHEGDQRWRVHQEELAAMETVIETARNHAVACNPGALARAIEVLDRIRSGHCYKR